MYTSNVVFIKYVFILFKVEKIRSGEEVITGSVQKTLSRK